MTNTAAALLDSRRTRSVQDAQLIALSEAKSSGILLAAHAELDSRANLDAAERLTLATIADVLTARHDLDDLIGAFYENDANFEATYHQALLFAMAAMGVVL